MTTSVFVGVSVDGFMARPNGDLDFLPEGGGEPHGYAEFIASVDAIVLGRKSFEKVLTFQPWPYGDKRVVVLSSRPVDLSLAKGGAVVRSTCHSRREARWNRWLGLQLKSWRSSQRAAPTTSTSMVASPFRDFCAQGAFTV
jgi:hypothetical protein